MVKRYSWNGFLGSGWVPSVNTVVGYRQKSFPTIDTLTPLAEIQSLLSCLHSQEVPL